MEINIVISNKTYFKYSFNRTPIILYAQDKRCYSNGRAFRFKCINCYASYSDIGRDSYKMSHCLQISQSLQMSWGLCISPIPILILISTRTYSHTYSEETNHYNDSLEGVCPDHCLDATLEHATDIHPSFMSSLLPSYIFSTHI